MNIVDYSNSFLAVLPPLTALLLAVLTRRVLFSLGMGILVGALLLNSFSPFGFFRISAAKDHGIGVG